MNNCREMNAGRGRESFFPVGRATVPRMDRRFSADRKKRLPTPSAPPLPVNTTVIHSPILSLFTSSASFRHCLSEPQSAI